MAWFCRALVVLAALSLGMPVAAQTSELRDLGRFQGFRESVLVGSGIVVGLTGSGDSPRNPVTQRALSNALGRLGNNISPDEMRSRNVAAVTVTATLPASGNIGDRLDVTVTSIGDARSLSGGVLLMTSLRGPDGQAYAVAQGPIVVGGYQFSSNQNVEQRNIPTTGVISDGGTLETAVRPQLQGEGGEVVFLLREPSYITAIRIADAVNGSGLDASAIVEEADRVRIQPRSGADVFRLMAGIEVLPVAPASFARVVVNERSGTIVAGQDVRISSVAVSQGDIRVSVRQRDDAYPPNIYGGFNEDVAGLVVRNTSIEVREDRGDAVVSFPNTTVGDLMEGLARVGVDTRGKIAVLQAIRAAGGLHADIIIQ